MHAKHKTTNQSTSDRFPNRCPDCGQLLKLITEVPHCDTCDKNYAFLEHQLYKAIKEKKEVKFVNDHFRFKSISATIDLNLLLKAGCASVETLTIETKNKRADIGTAIGNLISQCSNLKTLRFQDWLIPEHSNMPIVTAIAQNTTITSLYMEGSFVQSAWDHYAKLISTHKYIRNVTLKNLEKSPAHLLIKAIQNNPNITRFHWEYELDNYSALAMRDLLLNKHFDSCIIDCSQDLSSQYWSTLQHGLKHTKNTAIKLVLQWLHAWEVEDEKTFAKSLMHLPSITKLKLKDCNYLRDIWRDLSDVLKASKNITKVSLDAAEALEILGDNLFTNTSLTSFKIVSPSNNPFNQTLNRCAALKEGLKINKILTDLDLGKIEDDKICMDVLDGLKHNNVIRKLKLAVENLKKETVLELVNEIKFNRTVESFKLVFETVPIWKREITSFAIDIINTNTTLHTLHMTLHDNNEDNDIDMNLDDEDNESHQIQQENQSQIHQGPSQIQLMLDALKKNTSLTSVHLYNNVEWPNKIVEEIFEENKSIIDFHLKTQGVVAPQIQLCERNKKYQLTRVQDVIILIHNTARDDRGREMLPTEVWLMIFSYLQLPLRKKFEDIALAVFDKYRR